MANGNNGDSGQYKAKVKTTAENRLEAKLAHLRATAQAFLGPLPSIAQYLVEEESTPLLFQVKARETGGFMALLKVSGSPRDQIAFGTGDTPVEAINGLEVRILERGFSDAYSYEERMEMQNAAD